MKKVTILALGAVVLGLSGCGKPTTFSKCSVDYTNDVSGKNVSTYTECVTQMLPPSKAIAPVHLRHPDMLN